MAAPAVGAALRALGRRALHRAAAQRAGRGRTVGCGCIALALAVLPLILIIVIAGLVVTATPLGTLGFDGPPESASVASGVTPIACSGMGISQGYGDTPYEHPHTGIDLVCPEGTPVVAVAGGILRQRDGSGPCAFPAGAHGGLGMYGEIDAGNVAYLYGHLEAFAVADDVPVGAGTVIGFEGSSGCSTGFHLHFEVRVAGRANNPCPYLPQGYPAAHDIGGDRCWGAAPP